MFETNEAHRIEFPSGLLDEGDHYWHAVTLHCIRCVYILSYLVRGDDWTMGVDTLIHNPEFLRQTILQIEPGDITSIMVLITRQGQSQSIELKTLTSIRRKVVNGKPQSGDLLLTVEGDRHIYDENMVAAAPHNPTELVWEARN